MERLRRLLARRAELYGATALVTWFVVLDLEKVRAIAASGNLGVDYWIYRRAAESWVRGESPWLAEHNGFLFAAPPPTLLPYLPLVALPEWLGLAVMVTLVVAASIYAVARLRVPGYWLLYPPLFESVLVLNPDAIVIGLLLLPGAAAGLSIPTKLYAAVTLIAHGRWGAVMVGGLLCLISLPLWSEYLAALPEITATLRDQSPAVLSAWDTPLIVPTALAVLVLRRYDAGWLAAPALWPWTQHHYLALSLPVACRHPLAAAALALAVPLGAPLVVVALALARVLRRSAPKQEARALR